MNQEQFDTAIELLKGKETYKEKLEFLINYLKIDDIDLKFVTKDVILESALENKNRLKYRQTIRLSNYISTEVNILICPENSDFSISKENEYKNHNKLNLLCLKS